MSEVYIRSQNHEEIYTLNGSYAIKYKEFSVSKEHRIFICLSAESMYTLGVHESKERCIEVLDEIQAVCRSYLKGRRCVDAGRHGRTASSFYSTEILPDAREIVWQKSYYTHATQTIVRNVFFMAAVMAAARARITYRTATK